MKKTVEIKLYRPHELQKKFHDSNKRFRVVACGRQTGKTTMCLQELLRRAWEKENGIYWFISPTFSQAEDNYKNIVSLLTGVPIAKSDRRLKILLPSNSEIRFVSGEQKDHLRGRALDGVVIDEFRDQPPELYEQIIKPMLVIKQGWGVFISTPNGFDEFYELFQKGKSDPKNYDCFQAPSTANPFFSKEEYERLKNEMSEPVFAQEILAEFRDLTRGKVYLNFSKENIVKENPFAAQVEVAKYLPIIVSMDFNLNPMCWVLGQFYKKTFYFFKEFYLENSNTQDASIKLIEYLNKLQERKLIQAEPNLIITGDPAGKAGQRAAAGQSDYDIVLNYLRAHRYSYDFRVPDSHPAVKDRVNAVNAALKNFNGERKLFIHESMLKTIKDFERVVWKSNQSMIDKTNPQLTHLSDAIGYCVSELMPVQSVSIGDSKLRVIIR